MCRAGSGLIKRDHATPLLRIHPINLKPFNPPLLTIERMTRGKKPAAAIRETKKFAERMGCRWQENTENPDLGYYLHLLKPGYVVLVGLRVPRYHIKPNTF